MIVAPLKSNIQLSVVILILFCFTAWVATFAFSTTDISSINYKEHVLYSYFFDNHFSVLLNQIIILGIILLGAFFVNFLAIEQEITSKTN